MMTAEQMRKLELLDILFESLDVEELKKLAETELVVDKLKGDSIGTPLTDLYYKHTELQNRVTSLQAEVSSVQYDIQLLVRTVLKPYDYTSQSDVQTLKSKYHIY